MNVFYETDNSNQSKNITLEVFEKKINSPKESILNINNPLYNKNDENVILKSFSRYNKTLSICNNEDEDAEDENEEEYICGEAGEAEDEEEEYEYEDEEEQEDEEEDKDIVELFNIKIKGREKEYYTDNVENGDIYEIGKMDEIGPKVGKFVKGKVVMSK